MDSPGTKESKREMEVDGGCAVCGGPVAVKFSRSRAVSVCRECRHIAVANVHVEDGNLVFEQVVRAAA
jgi:recombinational DNA repair protein (RecF pathway)